MKPFESEAHTGRENSGYRVCRHRVQFGPRHLERHAGPEPSMPRR